ncbi:MULTISPECIES: hypothetical protein [unclassified Flavobacterium]|uniref:hypothetical protein n=1 Tax=unclassified Flavobacterium TaxID=196869 RepID=UPI001291EF32|nr:MULTISPECIES: hypothetical protein [unclassified Flavobacterium]MQP53376.1 hypothetical protein [Flavobacterium sp. LMO9]MQP63422.1 hypothetical protein [Flavobacterium sp. LMO6]
MAVQICSCEGLNAKCAKCFGSGYINTNEPEKIAKPEKKEKKDFVVSFLPNDLSTLQRKEIENIASKIIDSLDLKSKKQMQILHSIPFNTTTFRRDFKDKFETLKKMENEKQFLRNDLDIISKELSTKKYSTHFNFGHFLSDKVIDVTSNRDLKTLIREYKKLKR